MANFSRDTLERALVHHNIDYSPPFTGRPYWLVTTHLTREKMTSAQVYAFVVGLAMAEFRANRQEVGRG